MDNFRSENPWFDRQINELLVGSAQQNLVVFGHIETISLNPIDLVDIIKLMVRFNGYIIIYHRDQYYEIRYKAYQLLQSRIPMAKELDGLDINLNRLPVIRFDSLPSAVIEKIRNPLISDAKFNNLMNWINDCNPFKAPVGFGKYLQ